MRLITWLVVTLVLAVIGMGAIHGIQTYQAPREVSQMDALWERQVIAQNLNLGLERYRRPERLVTELNEAQIAHAKAELRKEISQGADRLDELNPSAEEKTMSGRLRSQLDDFFVLSAKLEPMLFLPRRLSEARSAESA